MAAVASRSLQGQGLGSLPWSLQKPPDSGSPDQERVCVLGRGEKKLFRAKTLWTEVPPISDLWLLFLDFKKRERERFEEK